MCAQRGEITCFSKGYIIVVFYSQMSTAFDSLFSNIWNSLDDILLCVSVFMISRILTTGLKKCLHGYFNTSKFVAQLTEFLTMSIIVIFLLGHLCNPTILDSVFGGVSIGVGYAFQPYIISFFTGMMIRTEDVLSIGDTLNVQGVEGVVEHIGMFYVCLDDGQYIPNTVFQSSGFKVQKRVQKRNERRRKGDE